MSSQVLGINCYAGPAPQMLNVFGVTQIEADHEKCSGGETTPGVMGGWVCICPCHRATKDANAPASSADQPGGRSSVASLE